LMVSHLFHLINSAVRRRGVSTSQLSHLISSSLSTSNHLIPSLFKSSNHNQPSTNDNNEIQMLRDVMISEEEKGEEGKQGRRDEEMNWIWDGNCEIISCHKSFNPFFQQKILHLISSQSDLQSQLSNLIPHLSSSLISTLSPLPLLSSISLTISSSSDTDEINSNLLSLLSLLTYHPTISLENNHKQLDDEKQQQENESENEMKVVCEQLVISLLHLSSPPSTPLSRLLSVSSLIKFMEFSTLQPLITTPSVFHLLNDNKRIVREKGRSLIHLISKT